ncbi:hypothetical protein [Paenibacillus radicis (ex Gao et al. 2016)]|uniref:Uncharacterized protein n=1 Tax=Paenibacillus radicis (ex Gao et al. 2016) TaxID=1737354 RepID=A0A917GML1_9BACL|nr:hypothetical protein [Paenibacillus radicis (ex Gao et al. 2016)]GGG51452.1 hypothetical protein GCM10010918_00160 [Paenibacillus radicis (ex Gao et al. 2016)]
MSRFIDEDSAEYSELSTVESQRNDLAREEFPEGPLGATIESESLGKSTPWRSGQRQNGPFSYENKSLHQGNGRHYPGDDEDLSIPDAMDEP